MATIRCLEIENFRSIRTLKWFPSSGINCLVGPGDSGKSSILDAIDFCLGARRNIQFDDSDFFELNVDVPIMITVTIGELDASLKSIENYGPFLRGYDWILKAISDEPERDFENVISVRLTVGGDLEPVWSLYSERTENDARSRSLNWTERSLIAPTRITSMNGSALSWRKGSVLSKLSDDKVDASAALAKVNRDARAAFGDSADEQLKKTRVIVKAVANELGIDVGGEVKAMLDLDSFATGSGALSLHSDLKVPLKSLGTGSTRLLLAALQARAAASSSILLLDELEHGLEPHRIIQLIESLRAKSDKPAMQVFVTTHSPVALREFSGDQIFMMKRSRKSSTVTAIGTADHIQGTLRKFPEAFLSPSVLVCEGGTEVGFVRGIDQHRGTKGAKSFSACGTVLIDGNGDETFKRASTFLSLGIRTAVLCDHDKTSALEESFSKGGGTVFKWTKGKAFEHELFESLQPEAIKALVSAAVEEHGPEIINDHIKSASSGKLDLISALANVTVATRNVFACASLSKKNSWFKNISVSEHIASSIIGPALEATNDPFKNTVVSVFKWIDRE